MSRRRSLAVTLALALSLPLLPALAAPAGADGGLAGQPYSQDSLVPSQGNTGYDVLHYDIDLTFTPAADAGPGGTLQGCQATTQPGAASIAATTTITATAPEPLDSFYLDFKGLTVDSVLVDGVPATWTRLRDEANDLFKLWVDPAGNVTGEFTVSVTYHGVPEAYSFDGGFTLDQGWLANYGTCYYVPCESGYCLVTTLADGGYTAIGQPSGSMLWFPSNMSPLDKATYTTRLTAPEGFAAVGIGTLESREPAGAGLTRWTWAETTPTPTFLAVASFGRWTEHTMTIDLNGREVAVWAFGNEAMEQASVAGGGWDRLEELLPEVLAWGEANFGTYQPDAAGYVIAPLEIGWSLEIMGRPVFTWAFSDIVFVHEYMHQWAGNSVTVADWSDLWLAEGFATYAEWLWTEDHGGMTALERAETYWSGLADTSALWSVAVAHPTREQLWGTWNYQGGALALTALRAGVGDAVFDQIVRDWFATYANSNASTDDFVALAEQVSGRDLSSWRATWLDTTGKPAAWPDTTTYPVDNPYASLYAFFHRLVALIHKLVASLQGIGQ